MTFEPIDVRDLVASPGTSRRVRVLGALDGLATELAVVDGPIEGDLLLESIVEGILVSGELAGAFRLRCARCLVELDRRFTVEIQELYCVDPDAEGDLYRLPPEGLIEPEPMLRDVVGVELPFAPLCRPDCQGLCSVCGEDRNLGACPGHDEIDPRWAALGSLALDRTAES